MQKRSLFLLCLLACDQPSLEEPKTLAPLETFINTDLSLDAGNLRVPNDEPCPTGMLLVEGDFCPSVEQKCLKWLDPDNKGVNGPVRCAEFQSPSRCLSKTLKPMRFCMDRFEYPNIRGMVPMVKASYYQAKGMCEDQGKRLCEADEFSLACEGPDIHPYPYGDGFHRDATACNIDQPWIDPFLYKDGKTIGEKPLMAVDQRVKSGSMPRCVSPFGIRDIVGNADEWVHNPSGHTNKAPWISGLKGGHWAMGARNRCRPMTDAHDPNFAFYETGFRCCKNP